MFLWRENFHRSGIRLTKSLGHQPYIVSFATSEEQCWEWAVIFGKDGMPKN